MMELSSRKAGNTVKLFLKKDVIGIKYSKSPTTLKNWGDALNAYLLPRITGKQILHYADYYNVGLSPTIAAIGSILDNNHVRKLLVWGSGFKSGESPMPVLPKKVFAVRGHLTRQRLKQLNVVCPEVYGDPAHILPKFYMPSGIKKEYKVGIVPHYIDKYSDSLASFRNNSEIKIIDVESDIEDFVDDIHRCEAIFSSSLHGLIAADAYHIPRVWLKLSDNVKGGEFKFMDYFSTTDVKVLKPDVLDNSIDRMVARAVQPQAMPDIDVLLDSFPS